LSIKYEKHLASKFLLTRLEKHVFQLQINKHSGCFLFSFQGANIVLSKSDFINITFQLNEVNIFIYTLKYLCCIQQQLVHKTNYSVKSKNNITPFYIKCQ